MLCRTLPVQPLERLSSVRPYPTVFNAPLMLSVFLQFAVHIAVLAQCVELSFPYLDAYVYALHAAVLVPAPTLCCCCSTIDPDGPFVPNVINTVVFLVAFVMQVSTFCVNYQVRDGVLAGGGGG